MIEYALTHIGFLIPLAAAGRICLLEKEANRTWENNPRRIPIGPDLREEWRLEYRG